MTNYIIVIGSGNHHNTLGIIRAIGVVGYGVNLITIEKNKRNYVASSKYVSNHVALVDVSELVDFLIKRDVCVKKEIIISCADTVTEQLNLHREIISKRYIIPGVPEEGRMPYLMDKTTMIKMAANHGIMSPETWTLPADRDKVTFPCITKTHASSHGCKSDIVICKNADELDTFLQNNTDELFAQTYIIKKDEVQFIGCSLRDGEEIIIPGMSKVLRSQPNTNTGFLEYGPIDPFYTDIVKKSKQYIRDCKYSGLFSIEFLRGQDDNVFFLEINFRNDGNAYCVTASGVNLPVIWVRANKGLDYSNELRDPKHVVVMPEFQDIKLVLQRKISLVQWLKDWKRTDCFLEYNKKDPKPFFQYIINKIL